MTGGRHPQTENNDLRPRRVDAYQDVTVPDGEGGRTSLAELEEPPEGLTEDEAAQIAVNASLIF